MSTNELNILSDEAIAAMAQEGSTTAYEFLIEKYRETAKVKARRFYLPGGDNEDVIQEGMIGIFKAIRDFDPGAGASFSTFLELCVDRQLKTAMSGANRQKHRILNEAASLSESPSGDGEHEQVLEDSLGAPEIQSPEEIALMKERMYALREESARVLSPFEQRVWRELLAGKNYREIAEFLNRSPKTIDNAIQRIKKKIRINLIDY